MQLPTMSTPMTRCIDLAIYAAQMLGKFPDRPRLAICSERMHQSRLELEAVEESHRANLRLALIARVDVSFEDYLSDQQIRRTQRHAQDTDNNHSGRLNNTIFPKGSHAITRMQGWSQVDSMAQVEDRLTDAKDIWPEAADEHKAVSERRMSYQKALEHREAIQRKIQASRSRRDAAKRRFLDLYAEVGGMVTAEFPRNSTMQSLFFDELRPRSNNTSSNTTHEDPEPTPDDDIIETKES